MAVKYSLISRKTVIVFSLIVILIICAIVGVGYLKKALTETTVQTDEIMFENMFSGSRYFFRIGYPTGWSYETGSYGFYLDEENHEVVELFPQRAIVTGEEDEDSEETEEKNIQYERISGCTIKIFHENIENQELSYTSEDAMDDLLYEIDERIGDSEYYTFGKKEQFVTDNVTMCKIDFEYTEIEYIESENEDDGETELETNAETELETDEETDEIYEIETVHKCSIYTVTRAMCKYVIVTDCEEELFETYEETIGKMLTDFRFSVFEN